MRTIGILNSDFINYHESDDLSYENKKLIRAANEYFENCILLDPSKIYLNMSPENFEVYYDVDGKNIIPELSAILIRRTRGFAEQIYDIVRAISFAYPNLPLFDPANAFDEAPISKVASLIKRQQKFNHPKTLIVLNPESFEIPSNFPFPAIIKPTHGFKGRHIKKCLSSKEATDFMKQASQLNSNYKEYQSMGYGFILQEFIDFTEEYRVNVINGKAIGSVIKISDNDIKNADQGAVFAKKHNEHAIKIAEACAKIHNLFFAGADIARKDDTYYVLECNRNPAFEHFDEALKINTAQFVIENISRNLIDNSQKKMANDLEKNEKNKKSHIELHQIYGNVYLNSTQIKSPTTINVTKEEEETNLISQLIDLISAANISSFSKNDAIHDLNSIQVIKDQSENSDVLQSVERKLESVNKIIASSSTIATKASPLIERLAELFNINL